jgi:hypothetical protein
MGTLATQAKTEQELQFHLYLKSLPIQEREVFDGRLDLANFAIPELAQAFEDARGLINTAWAANAARIVAPDGAIALHLDYINSSVVNAITFGYEGTYFVGLTGAMLEHLAKTSSTLWSSDEVGELLDIEVTDEPEDPLFQALLLTQLQFISSHEVGHLFHGHLPRNAFRAEFRNSITTGSADRMKDQTLEVEADAYAVHLLLNNALLSDTGELIRARLKSRLTKEDCILTLIMISIGSLFYFLDPLKFEADTVRYRDHPFALARMNVVMREITNWCKLNLPGYADWASLPRFQRVMALVVSAGGSEERFNMWLRQGDYLRSLSGAEYTSDLYRLQDNLHSERDSLRWCIEHEQE